MNYKCTNDPKISALMKKAKRAAQRNITKWMFDMSENADIKSPFYINKKKKKSNIKSETRLYCCACSI